MHIPKFKKGDRVKVLTWDEMLSRGATPFNNTFTGEGALDVQQDLTNYLFLESMRQACGLEFVISKDPTVVEPGRYPHEQSLAECSELLPGSGIHNPITNFMVKLVNSKYPSNWAGHGKQV